MRGPIHELDAGNYYAEVVDSTPMIFRADTIGAVTKIEETEPRPLQKYEVIFRDPMSGDRWSYFFQAENFAHAEEQAYDTDMAGGQVIQIVLDFD